MGYKHDLLQLKKVVL